MRRCRVQDFYRKVIVFDVLINVFDVLINIHEGVKNIYEALVNRKLSVLYAIDQSFLNLLVVFGEAML